MRAIDREDVIEDIISERLLLFPCNNVDGFGWNILETIEVRLTG